MKTTLYLLTSLVAVVSVGCGEGSPPPSQPIAPLTPEAKMNAPEAPQTPEVANPQIVLETSMGSITIELNREKAPVTVDNFLRYVDEKHYDGTIFHRVIKGFMIQGGGFEPGMNQKATHDQIFNEAANGLKNLRGTIAMARTGDPHSASAQFFINHTDNGALDYTSSTPAGFGYCVFGKVVDGMDVVDKIATVATGQAGPFGDVPTENIVLKSATRK